MTRERKRVLIVDDSTVIQRLVTARLQIDGFEIITAGNGNDGLQLAIREQPDVILLDVDMPGMNGHDTVRALKNDSRTRFIPVIFLTAHTQVDEKVRGLDLGAIDYVTKPFDPVELRARVRSAYRLKFLLNLLEHKAQIDGLTGLYNRAHFNSRLKEEFHRAERYGHALGLVLLDIDHFKRLNDTYGHTFGDQVLAEIGETARSLVRTGDVVARYGGEEFVVILPEQDLEGAGRFAERWRSAVETTQFDHYQEKIHVTASLGVAAFKDHVLTNPTQFIDCADKALYQAKNTGRNRVCFWRPDGTIHLYASGVFEPAVA